MQRLEKRLGKERILYMDEAGMLAGDVYRWGWSEKGRRKYGQRSGKRQRRVNFIAIHRKFQTRRAAEDSTRLYGEAAQHSMRLSVDGYIYD